MMDCKKALASPEVDGDIAKGLDWLRAKGIAKATSQVNFFLKEMMSLVMLHHFRTAEYQKRVSLQYLNMKTRLA